ACCTFVLELLAQFWFRESGDNDRIEFIGYCPGKVGWREHAEPCTGLKSGHGLSDRRKIRKEWLSLHARHTISAQFSRANLLGSRHQADEHEIDLPAQKIAQRRCRPLVRDIEQIHSGHLLEFFACKMQR